MPDMPDLVPLPGGARRHRPVGQMIVSAAVVAVLASSIAVLVALAGDQPASEDEAIEDSDDLEPDQGRDADAETLPVEVDVAGPYDGLESVGLPVTARPAEGLVDGQEVVVSGSGFGSNEPVGVLQCWGPGNGSGGVDNCDLGNYVLATSNGNGSFTATLTVRRFITNATGEHDCAAPDGTLTCLIAVGAVYDYDRSGTVVTTFAPDAAGDRAPTLAVTPAEGLVHGTELAVTGVNFEPGETVLVTQCVIGGNSGIDTCVERHGASKVQADADGELAVTIAARRVLPGGDDCVENPYGCRVVAIGSARPNPMPLRYDPSAAPPAADAPPLLPADALFDGDVVHVDMAAVGARDGEEFTARQCLDRSVSEELDPVCSPGVTGRVEGGRIVFALAVTATVDSDLTSYTDCAGWGGAFCHVRVESGPYLYPELEFAFDPSVEPEHPLGP